MPLDWTTRLAKLAALAAGIAFAWVTQHEARYWLDHNHNQLAAVLTMTAVASVTLSASVLGLLSHLNHGRDG